MSLDQKAFLFNYDDFNIELKSLIESCLETDNFEKVREFVLINKSLCKDPYEGEELSDDWECMIEDKDVHQYGDFALTRFYLPDDDKGLGYGWERVHRVFQHTCGLKFSPLLGVPIGVESNLFDPGKLGSYFQSYDDVIQSSQFMETERKNIADELIDMFDRYADVLNSAIEQRSGLYVTF